MNADVRGMQFIPGIANIKTSFTMFNPRPVVGFEVNKIALMQVFLVLGFLRIIVIPPLCHAHLFIYHRRYKVSLIGQRR
jgi:hypothetical protein